MNHRNLKFFLVMLLVFVASGITLMRCGGPQKPPGTAPKDLRESLIKANKEVVRTEIEQIDDFVARYGWDMNSTSTGLRYMVYQKGTGLAGIPGKQAKLNYTLSLLTGDTVYTSKKDGPIEFPIGQGQVISGLEEAILLLRVGDRAKIIIPSHLAYGLIGDQTKIHHKASLVYDVEFVSMY
jgi:FKBP-type peptidyl-prolyl cis-trans isomerase